MDLLNDDALARSSVVANCRMNRERTLTGSNGYTKELGFNPLEELRERVRGGKQSAWLDLCCGTGAALVEAAMMAEREGFGERIQIVGVDLVLEPPHSRAKSPILRLVEASLSKWEPDQRFDIVTCVHGLHYIGDKLGIIQRATSWLTDDGRFTANLDLSNIHIQDDSKSDRNISSELRKQGLTYNRRTKLIECEGQRDVHFALEYLGANDEAGPNYTQQPAVDSYYRRAARKT